MGWSRDGGDLRVAHFFATHALHVMPLFALVAGHLPGLPGKWAVRGFAGLYVTLHAEFLAAVQIIVYAGAILVLYLFVVMLLNLHRDDRYHSQWRTVAFVCVPLLIEFMVLIAGSIAAAPQSIAPADAGSGENTLAIGEVLFSTYLFPFEVASLILLVAMIGAIILAKRDFVEAKGDA